jgi:hypothetical protein
MTVNLNALRAAALELGHAEPISIEPDGVIWLGIDPDRTYLTAAQQKALETKAAQTAANTIAARNSASGKLKVLGLTDAEIAALIGG